jgi:glycosyltransferase involved in cell wall biosynthesis
MGTAMSENPAISVICPCFNHGCYAQEMLDSVKAQTLRDHEVVIVDDGSTDDTAAILDQLVGRNLSVIHTPNRGPSAARNTAIAAAKAPLILNLDADDKIAPTLLEKAFAVFNANPEFGIVHSDVRFFGARSGRFDLPPYSLPAMLTSNVIPSIAFFRKEDWGAVGGYSEELRYGLEDYGFWLSLIELGRKVHKIPEDLIFYRQYEKSKHCRSGRRKSNREHAINAMLTIFQRHEKLFRSSPEVYEQMSALKKLSENESAILKWVKQFRWSLKLLINRNST